MKQIMFILLAVGCIFALSPSLVYGNSGVLFCAAEFIADGGGENAYPVGQVYYDWYDSFGYGAVYCDPEEIPLLYVMLPGTPYCMDVIHHDWQTDPSDFPQTKTGNPIPGKFSGNYELGGCYRAAISCVAKEELCSLGGYNAVQMEVKSLYDELYGESAWAECILGCTAGNFLGNNWATYFGCEIPPEICVASIGG